MVANCSIGQSSIEEKKEGNWLMIFQFNFESILSRKVREHQAQIVVQAETLSRQAQLKHSVLHICTWRTKYLEYSPQFEYGFGVKEMLLLGKITRISPMTLGWTRIFWIRYRSMGEIAKIGLLQAKSFQKAAISTRTHNGERLCTTKETKQWRKTLKNG